jgi:hypothetical protein
MIFSRDIINIIFNFSSNTSQAALLDSNYKLAKYIYNMHYVHLGDDTLCYIKNKKIFKLFYMYDINFSKNLSSKYDIFLQHNQTNLLYVINNDMSINPLKVFKCAVDNNIKITDKKLIKFLSDNAYNIFPILNLFNCDKLNRQISNQILLNKMYDTNDIYNYISNNEIYFKYLINKISNNCNLYRTDKTICEEYLKKYLCIDTNKNKITEALKINKNFINFICEFLKFDTILELIINQNIDILDFKNFKNLYTDLIYYLNHLANLSICNNDRKVIYHIGQKVDTLTVNTIRQQEGSSYKTSSGESIILSIPNFSDITYALSVNLSTMKELDDLYNNDNVTRLFVKDDPDEPDGLNNVVPLSSNIIGNNIGNDNVYGYNYDYEKFLKNNFSDNFDLIACLDLLNNLNVLLINKITNCELPYKYIDIILNRYTISKIKNLTIPIHLLLYTFKNIQKHIKVNLYQIDKKYYNIISYISFDSEPINYDVLRILIKISNNNIEYKFDNCDYLLKSINDINYGLLIFILQNFKIELNDYIYYFRYYIQSSNMKNINNKTTVINYLLKYYKLQNYKPIANEYLANSLLIYYVLNEKIKYIKLILQNFCNDDIVYKFYDAYFDDIIDSNICMDIFSIFYPFLKSRANDILFNLCLHINNTKLCSPNVLNIIEHIHKNVNPLTRCVNIIDTIKDDSICDIITTKLKLKLNL